MTNFQLQIQVAGSLNLCLRRNHLNGWGGCVAAAIFGGAPADPFLESVGEGEGVIVTDRAGDDVDFVAGVLEEVGSAAHAEVGDLMHGGATEMLMAKAAEMFGAAIGELGESLGGPAFVEA